MEINKSVKPESKNDTLCGGHHFSIRLSKSRFSVKNLLKKSATESIMLAAKGLELSQQKVFRGDSIASMSNLQAADEHNTTVPTVSARTSPIARNGRIEDAQSKRTGDMLSVAPSTRELPYPTYLGSLQIQGGVPPLGEHPAAVYVARLSPGSRRTIVNALNTIAGLLTHNMCDMSDLNWSALRYQHTAALRSLLIDRYAPATTNKMLSALRGVLQEAWRLGIMNTEAFKRACDLAPARGSGLLRGRAVSVGELSDILSKCNRDPNPNARRDAAILAVLYNCGLRCNELASLELSDYNQSQSLTVRKGKGLKARSVYVNYMTRSLLREWLSIRGYTSGMLFQPISKVGKLQLRQMSTQAIRKMLMRRAAQAGVSHFTPHDLRRTMIGDMLDAGADIVTVQHIAGHSSVTITARYDRRGEHAKWRAAELLIIPTGGEEAIRDC